MSGTADSADRYFAIPDCCIIDRNIWMTSPTSIARIHEADWCRFRASSGGVLKCGFYWRWKNIMSLCHLNATIGDRTFWESQISIGKMSIGQISNGNLSPVLIVGDFKLKMGFWNEVFEEMGWSYPGSKCEVLNFVEQMQTTKLSLPVIPGLRVCRRSTKICCRLVLRPFPLVDPPEVWAAVSKEKAAVDLS